jgi:hypothetical protein
MPLQSALQIATDWRSGTLSASIMVNRPPTHSGSAEHRHGRRHDGRMSLILDYRPAARTSRCNLDANALDHGGRLK